MLLNCLLTFNNVKHIKKAALLCLISRRKASANTYPPVRSRRHVRQPQRRRLAGGLGGGAEGGVAAGELPVSPPVARGEVQEGQHQLGGVAVAVSLRAAPPLMPAVGRYDLGQRQAEHLGCHLCMGRREEVIQVTWLDWSQPRFTPVFKKALPHCAASSPAVSLIFRAKCLKTDRIYGPNIRSNN